MTPIVLLAIVSVVLYFLLRALAKRFIVALRMVATITVALATVALRLTVVGAVIAVILTVFFN